MARLVSLIVLTVLMVFLGITFFKVIAPFLLPLFLAAVLAILCQPIYEYFLKKTGSRPRVAAALTTVAVLGMFLVPLLVGTFVGSIQLYTIAQETLDSPEWNQAVSNARTQLEIDNVVARLDSILPRKINPEKLQAELQTGLKKAMTSVAEQSMGLATGAIGFLGSLASAMISIVMFVIALYYFLADGPALLAASEGLIPVHVEYQRQLFKQFNQVIRAVVLSTLLAAVAQGLATAIALWAIGIPHFFLIFMLATIASMIPLAGSWIVWGPFAVWLAFTGQWWQAGLLTVFGTVVIGTLDNVIRTYVLNSDAKLHPLLAFVSVLGGLQAMGLWGVFVGPVVASCLHALVQIFNSELKEFSVTRLAEAQAGEEDAPAGALVRAKPDSQEVSQPATQTTNAAKPTPAAKTGKKKRRRKRR